MTWHINSSTDPQGIDDIFAERLEIHNGERIDRQEIEARLNEYDALLAVAPFAGHLERCLRVNYGVDQECDCGYTKALAFYAELMTL